MKPLSGRQEHPDCIILLLAEELQISNDLGDSLRTNMKKHLSGRQCLLVKPRLQHFPCPLTSPLAVISHTCVN